MVSQPSDEKLNFRRGTGDLDGLAQDERRNALCFEKAVAEPVVVSTPGPESSYAVFLVGINGHGAERLNIQPAKNF